MAQPIQNISIAAPGFFGLNTQDSPVGLDPSFASIADNCVIDKQGRIGTRQGYAYSTTNAAAVLGTSDGIESLFRFTDRSGDVHTVSAGNLKVFSGTTTLVDETPALYTPTANNWKQVSFNNSVYMVQRDHEALIGNDAGGSFAITAHAAAAGAAGVMPEANEVLAAYGRLWCGDITGNRYTVYWSDLLNGAAWTGGTSGSIDLTTVWPTGYDEIVALAAHNGFLIIFGRTSMLVYGGAENPATMALVDTVAGVGCIARDSVVPTGDDLIFLSSKGVRSFSRTIQEKSIPMRDISKNVRNDILALYRSETLPIKAAYSASDAFYLIVFPLAGVVYCFDMRTPLEDGSYRATTWSGIVPRSLHAIENGLLFGMELGVSTYTGFTDNGAAYQQSYFSNPLDFGVPTNLKFLKKFNLTVIGGGNASATLNWGYDYRSDYYKQVFTFADASLPLYGEAEYGIAEYSSSTAVNLPKVNASGSGSVVTIGMEVQINGAGVSIQKIDIHALIGRTI